MESNKFDDQELERDIFRISYALERALNKWGEQYLNAIDYPNFHTTYMPYFMQVIGSPGISNNDLAVRMGVTKQAVSRIIKGLIASGLIRSEKSDTDGRSSILHLTSEGEKFYGDAQKMIRQLVQQYQTTISANNYNRAIDTLLKIIKFHKDNDYAIYSP